LTAISATQLDRRPVSTPATVNAIVPLALLEAIRNLDTPLDDGLPAELAAETITKRLGLSTTVAAQIQRYREMADGGLGVSEEEAVQVFRLVGRRPDATLGYSDAGRRAARLAARRNGGDPPWIWRLLPGSVRRRAGERRAGRALSRVFGIALDRDGDNGEGAAPLSLRLTESLATRSGFEGNGCYFYAALAAELLRITSGFEGSMVHDRCRVRGDELCRWRAADADRTW
jgi:hypothetical protein